MIIRLSSFPNESLCHHEQPERGTHTVYGVTLPSNVTVFNAVELMNLCDFMWFNQQRIHKCILIKRLQIFSCKTKRHV